MSLLLPTADSHLREMFEVSQLVNQSALPTFRQSLTSCRNYLANDKKARSANAVCMRADGQIWLIKVTPKAWKRLWNFSR